MDEIDIDVNRKRYGQAIWGLIFGLDKFCACNVSCNVPKWANCFGGALPAQYNGPRIQYNGPRMSSLDTHGLPCRRLPFLPALLHRRRLRRHRALALCIGGSAVPLCSVVHRLGALVRVLGGG